VVKDVVKFVPSDDFSAKYDQPALLKGWARFWPAFTKWSLDYFAKEFGDHLVPMSNYHENQYQKVSDKPLVKVSDYINMLTGKTTETSNSNKKTYLAGWHFKKPAPELMDDINIPECFQDNLLDEVSQNIVYYHEISLFIGHDQVESPLHTDSFAVSVWLANIIGTKRIRLIPPVDYDKIYNGLDAFDDEVVVKLAESNIPVYEATIEAGDIFFIPPGYWHQVKNDSITVAISTNYLSPFHFLTFEQQLRAKLLGPLLKLMKLRDRVLETKGGELYHSMDALKHFNYVETESKYLNYMINKLEGQRQIVQSIHDKQLASEIASIENA